MKRIIFRKVSDESFEAANSLFPSTYNIYRESYCVTLPSGVNIYLVPSRLSMETQVQPGLDGVEILDVSIPRKLLLWAFALLHGRYVNILAVVKYCEETIKQKVRKGAGTQSVSPAKTTPLAKTIHTGIDKEDAGASQGGSREPETAPIAFASVSKGENAECVNPPVPAPSSDSQKSSITTPNQGQYNETMAERSSVLHKDDSPDAC